MGLAASQARFLGITARKSNIEYEGQQVNQQRTALAEEVNALYNKLLSLELPIAPDTTKFYESNYSFSITGREAGIEGDYLVKNYFQNDDGTYYIMTERTYKKNTAEGYTLYGSQWNIIKTADDKGNDVYQLINTAYGSQPITLTRTENGEVIDLLNNTKELGINPPITAEEGLFTYQTEDGATRYFRGNDILNYQQNQNLMSYARINKSITESKAFERVGVKFDDNGRMAQMDIFDENGEELVKNLGVETKRTYNTEGYNAALRDYTMSKDEYDKMVADLNAQTESLQQEDKVLELRLNQIDTEQKELQTELDAVKEVLKKNIEGTFKTFA